MRFQKSDNRTRDSLKQFAIALAVGAGLAAGGAHAASPVLSGLTLHLDASEPGTMTLSGSTVNEWRDLQGSSAKMTLKGGAPTLVASGIGGIPTVHFNNSAWMNDGVNHTAPTTIFYVSRETGSNNNRVLGASSNNWLMGYHGGQRNRFYFEGWVAGNGDGLSPDANPHLYVATIPGSGQNSTVWAEGAQLATNQNGIQGPNNLELNGYGNGSELSDCDISEVLVYNRVLTGPELDLVGGYLTVKYSLTTSYPPPNLTVKLTSPFNNEAFPTNSDVIASAKVISGTAPYSVSFYKRTGAGAFAQVGSTQTDSGPTFTQDLGTLPNQTYEVYASVTDSVGAPATSTTNAFAVADPVATSIALGTSHSPSSYGQSVTISATISPTPAGGTVQFYDNSSPLGSPVAINAVTGTASISSSLLAVGVHSITADYSGYGISLGSTAPTFEQDVVPAVLTVKADTKIRIPGTDNPTLTYKITGYQNGENLASSGVTGSPDLFCPADSSSSVGSYDITCGVGSLSAANYSFATINASLTVQVGAPPVSSGMVCWYDASTIALADGAQVNTWNDLSGNGHTATRTSGAPKLAYGDIKYNSSEVPKKGVHFRGTSDWFDCAGGMFVKEQYVVVRSPNPAWVGSGSFLGRRSVDFLSVRASSHNLYSGYSGFWDDQLPAAVSRNGSAVSSSRGSMPRGGFELAPITDYMLLKIVANTGASAANLAAYPFYNIGRTETLSGAEMDIAEMIGFETTLSAADEAAMGAYLAAKYGLLTTYPDTSPQALVRSFAVTGMTVAIDQARRSVVINANIGSDVSALQPSFTLSDGATATVNGSPFASGVTPINGTGLPLHCIVTSSDGLITSDYTIVIRYISPLGTAITILDVTAATGDGREILNDGTLVEANHVGASGVTAVTLPNGLVFGTSTSHMTGYGSGAWGGGGQSTNTDSNSAGSASQLTDATDYGKLMREYIWSSVNASHLDIPGLTPGHTYRLQWITTSPRGGNISVEGSPSVALAPNSAPARVFAFTWVATDTVANAVVTRQAGSYPTDSEIVFNGYALHDMSVAIPGALISGVTSSQTIAAGTPTVTLSGTVCDASNSIYPTQGEAVSVTINGVTEYTPLGGGGSFSVAFPTASLIGGINYPITYSYGGNWITLASAPDNTSTMLAVSSPAIIGNVTPSPTRVVGGYPTVTLGGTVSNGGAAFAAAGELVHVSINGVTQTTSISGSAGAFSLAFPIAGIPLGAHTITYSYAGNGLMLGAAPDHIGTTLTLVATAGTAYETLVKASGPVSYWPLNETSGTTALDVSGSNNITYGGTYTLNQESLRSTDGQPSVLFTSATTAAGGNTGIPYNSSLNPPQFTVEFWYKHLNTGTAQYLVSLQDRSGSPAANRLGYAFQRNNAANRFQFTYGIPGNNNGTIQSSTDLVIGNVYHVVATYDGTTMSMYVNGVSNATASASYVQASATQPGFTIGSRNGNTSAACNIQDVALYNRALSGPEVLAHYQGGVIAAGGYSDWAATYAGGQAANLDYNHDGVQNGIAYFMGKNGIATNPGVVLGKVNWPHANAVTSFGVQVSSDLVNWAAANPADVDTVSSPGHVIYTLPSGAGKKFCRLTVVP